MNTEQRKFRKVMKKRATHQHYLNSVTNKHGAKLPSSEIHIRISKKFRKPKKIRGGKKNVHKPIQN